jgi:hypothetical protein
MIDVYKDEKWVDILFDELHPEEKFQISNFGRIRSFKVSPDKPKIIKGSWLSGYNILVLRLKNRKSTTFYVHKLVALNFVENDSPDRKFVVHLDYNKANNHYLNLKWVNRQELNEHRRNDSEYDKKKIRNSKLTEIEVKKIKKMLKRGTMKPYRVAQQFGISQTQLMRIKNGTNWGHITID